MRSPHASALSVNDSEDDAVQPSQAPNEDEMQEVTPVEEAQMARARAREDEARELVIKARKGELSSHDLVLKMLDTGGQPEFLPLLELLLTPEGTVYVVIISLTKLQDSFDATVASTISQLHSIQLLAAGALSARWYAPRRRRWRVSATSVAQ